MYRELVPTEPLTYIGLDDIRQMQAELTLAELHDAVNLAWADMRAGRAFGGKAVLSLPEEDFWQRPEFSTFKMDFAEQRLGWKLSSLYSINAESAAVKIIGANAFNRTLGLPRSTSTILLLDKLTMRPLVVLDGTAISASRTGTYASTVFERCFSKGGKISVFLFGAGPIARSVIACLDHIGSGGIQEICVRSRGLEGAVAMAKALQPKTVITLVPVNDNARLRDCAFVITASNARQPVFRDDEIRPDAITLHLGGDEVPERYVIRVLRTGTIACDNLAMVSHRGSQSLALHFKRKGLSLETVGPILGLRDMSASPDWYRDGETPVCITCVGLPMLDLYAAQATYRKYLRLRALTRST
jgi:alanine dehydrogenase